MDISQPISYFDVLGQAKKNYSKWLEPICRKWELTRSELDILLFLYNNPTLDRAADIVTRRGIAKSHVSMSVTNLEDRGRLMRCFEPADRRTAHLKLTESGRDIAQEARKIQIAFFERIYAGVSPEELAAWNALTEKVCRNIENMEE